MMAVHTERNSRIATVILIGCGPHSGYSPTALALFDPEPVDDLAEEHCELAT